MAFTCQIGALVGWASPATLLSLSLSLGVAALCVAGLAQGAVMVRLGSLLSLLSSFSHALLA